MRSKRLFSIMGKSVIALLLVMTLLIYAEPSETDAAGGDFQLTLYVVPEWSGSIYVDLPLYEDVLLNRSFIRGGRSSINLMPITFKSGTTVSLKVTPQPQFRFINWSGDATGNTDSITVIMDSDKEIMANFERIEHTLTIQVNGEGYTGLSEGVHKYWEGTEVNVGAHPHENWHFDGWTGDINSKEEMIKVTMNSDMTITANFSENGENSESTSWGYIIGGITGIAIFVMAIGGALRRRKA